MAHLLHASFRLARVLPLLALAACSKDVPISSRSAAVSIPPVLPSTRYTAIYTPGPAQDFTAPATIRVFAIGYDSATDFLTASRVEFLLDGAVAASSSTGQYGNFQATLTGVAAGSHVLKTRSYHQNGQVLESYPVPVTVLAATAPTGPVFDLAQDIVLTGAQNLDIIGTATQRARIIGRGRQIRTSGAWTGRLTIRNADVFGLGQESVPGIAVTASGAGAVTIEGSAFEGGGQVAVTANDSAAAALRGNTFRANMLIPVTSQPSTSEPVVLLQGNSPTQKFFQGNRIGLSWAHFNQTRNWLIGGGTDADSNILIGARAGIQVILSTGMVLRRNYCHQDYHGGWSQGMNFEFVQSPGLLVEHNVIRHGSWPTRGLDGELRYNLLVDNSHAWVASPATNAYVHHNVLISVKAQGLYGPEEGVSLYNNTQNVRMHNNTFDGGGVFMSFYGPPVRVSSGTLSFRSNVISGFTRTFPSIIGATGDYNDFYNLGGAAPQNYSGGVRGAHDLGAAVNAQVDPRFAQARPLPYPIDEGEVWNRRLTVAQVLAQYRVIYTPGSGSPLIDAGDPAGGTGNDIGAVGAGVASAFDLFGRPGATPPPPPPPPDLASPPDLAQPEDLSQPEDLASPPPPSGELLLNPSIESWSGTAPASWFVTGTVSRYAGGDVQNGGAAAQVAATSYGHGISQDVTFATPRPAGTVLTASAYFRWRAGATGAPLLQLIVEYADGAATSTVNQGVPGWPGGGAWLQATRSFTTTHPVSQVSLRLLSNTGSAQTFQIDAASVQAE